MSLCPSILTLAAAACGMTIGRVADPENLIRSTAP
jgi:hypothetical protein